MLILHGHRIRPKVLSPQTDLSGSVWLYNSPLTSFAISRLEIINPQIFKDSLTRASYLEWKA